MRDDLLFSTKSSSPLLSDDEEEESLLDDEDEDEEDAARLREWWLFRFRERERSVDRSSVNAWATKHTQTDSRYTRHRHGTARGPS